MVSSSTNNGTAVGLGEDQPEHFFVFPFTSSSTQPTAIGDGATNTNTGFQYRAVILALQANSDAACAVFSAWLETIKPA